MAPPRVSAVQQLEHDISRFSLSHSTRSNTKAQLLQPGEPLTANQIDLTAQLPGVRGRNEIGECRLVVEKHTPDHESIQAFFRQINNNKNTFDIITQNLDADAFQGAVRLLELKVLDVKVPELNDSDWSIYYAENIPAQDIEENRFPLKERLDLLKTTGCDLNSALSMAIQVQNLPFIKALTEIGVGHESLSPDRNNTMHVLCMKSNTMTLDEVINQIFLFAKTKAMNICECNMDGKTPIDMVISHHPTFLSTFEQHLRAKSNPTVTTPQTQTEIEIANLLKGILTANRFIFQDHPGFAAIAIQSFTLANKKNNSPEAIYLCGLVHSNILGTPQSLQTGKQLIHQAAYIGLPTAAETYGLILLRNTNNKKEALPWLTMAAQQGVSTAMHQLGLLAKEGFNLDEANPTHPNVWFNRAARQGNADSMYELGKFYQAIAEKAYEENPHNILEDSFAVQEMLLMYENAQVHGSYEASQELAMIYVSNTLVPFSNESGYNAINANRYQASHPSPIAKQSSWDPNFTVISLLAQCPQTQHTKEEIVMRAGLAIKNLFLPHNHKNLQDYAYNILELLPADQKTLPINGHNVEISEIHHEITKRRLNAEETATLAEKTRLEPEKKPDETAKTSQEL